jgi:lipopolysaccharide heptosyltransferase I
MSRSLTTPDSAIGFPPKRLLVVRLSAMGDVIHTLPAAAALRQAFPECMIGWVIDERWAELLCAKPAPREGNRSPQRPVADRVHTVNMKGWRHAMLSRATWKEMADARRRLRSQQYEAAIDFQGAIRSALVARLSGAPVIYGFALPRENIATMFYTKKVGARGTHIIEQNLSLAAAVAAGPLTMPEAELPCDEAADRECERKLREFRVRDFAMINPGAGWGAKQWPAERYGEVAQGLAAKGGLATLINFGPGEESLARAAQSASHGAARALTCSVSELIAFTRRARLVVGGDTGPLHLAAALRVPVVAIFGPTNPARNGPFGTRSVVLRNPASPTSHKRRKEADEAMLEITSTEVLAAAMSLLRDSRG